MINKFLKKWLFTTIYLYIMMLFGGFNLPFDQTLLPAMFNQIYLYLFILSFCIALIMQAWEQLLPTLNNQLGPILGIFVFITIFLYNLASINIHIVILILILAGELIIYRTYNKPQPKQNTLNKTIISGVICAIIVGLFALFSHSSYTKVIYYQDAFPTRDEIMYDYNLSYAYRQVEINYTAGQRADNLYATYSFQNGIVSHINSSMFVNGYSKSCYGYEYYKSVPNDENYKLIHESEYCVYQSIQEPSYYSGLYNQEIVTIYHNENYSVYSTFTFQYKDTLDLNQTLNAIDIYHQYFINFE